MELSHVLATKVIRQSMLAVSVVDVIISNGVGVGVKRVRLSQPCITIAVGVYL